MILKRFFRYHNLYYPAIMNNFQKPAPAAHKAQKQRLASGNLHAHTADPDSPSAQCRQTQ